MLKEQEEIVKQLNIYLGNLETLERPSQITLDEVNDIKNKFNNCYEYLTKLYNETILNRQVIINPLTQDLVYVSDNLSNNYIKNYLALIYYNYLIEYEIFYFTHMPTLTFGNTSYINNNIGTGIPIKTYQKYLLQNHNPINPTILITNILDTDFKSNFGIHNNYRDEYTINPDGTRKYTDTTHNVIRVYKNDLDTLFNNNHRMLRDFTIAINLVTNLFITNLINKLVESLNVPNDNNNIIPRINYFTDKITKCIIPEFAINKDNIRIDLGFGNEEISDKWDYIYDNWMDRICELLINENNDPNIEYKKIYDLRLIYFADPNRNKIPIYSIIYDNIIESINKVFTTTLSISSNYISEGTGLFSWLYLINYKNIKSIGDINKMHASCIGFTVIEQYFMYKLHFNAKDIYFNTEYISSQIPHEIWLLTQDRYSDEINKKISNTNISHWMTIINNKFNNNKKLIRSATGDVASNSDVYNPNTKINLIKDRNIYFKILVYNIIDSEIQYLNINKNKLSDRQYQKYIQTIYDIYNFINNTINKYTHNTSLEELSKNFTESDQPLLTNLNYISLVNSIINRQNPLNNTLNSVLIEIDPENIDTNEWLKGLSTDFINKYFFSFDIITGNLMKLINDTFSEGLKTYFTNNPNYARIVDTNQANYEDYIKFIFKGGNVMAYVLFSFINQLPLNIRNLLINKFKKNFKKSDSDFSILIKDISAEIGREQMDLIYNQLTDLSYLLLNRIRDIMVTDIQNYCSFYSYSEKIRKSLFINKLLKSINNTPNQKRSEYYSDASFNGIEYDNIFYSNLNDDINTFDKLIKFINSQPIQNTAMAARAAMSTNTASSSAVESLRRNQNRRNKFSLIEKLNKYNDFGTSENRNSRRDFKIEAYVKNSTNYAKISYINYIHESPEIYPLLRNDVELEKKIFYNKSETNFYITHNTSINATDQNDEKKFNLVRIKVNIKAHYYDSSVDINDRLIKPNIVNIPGEFIDVSIPHYKTTEKYFNPLSPRKLDIEKYTMNINDDDNINYTFNAYSYNTFFYDLITALFDNKKYTDDRYKVDMPWYNNKMEKRTERIMLFILIDIARRIVIPSNTPSRTESYNDIVNDFDILIGIIDPIIKILNNENINFVSKMDSLEVLNIHLNKHIFITNPKYNDFLIKYFIVNILTELNNNFIYMINIKNTNNESISTNSDLDYYFKSNEYKVQFMNDNINSLFNKFTTFYNIISIFIRDILSSHTLNLLIYHKSEFKDIKIFEPIKL